MLPSAAILTFWILKSIAESTLYSKIEGQQKSKALNTLDAVVSITFNETTLRAGGGKEKKLHLTSQRNIHNKLISIPQDQVLLLVSLWD